MKRTPLKRKAKKGWRSVRRDPVDVLWSKVVRERDAGTCQGLLEWSEPSVCPAFYRDECGRMSPEYQIEAAHIISRRYKNTRWDPRNGVALCHLCHKWAHAHTTEFQAWAKERLGDTYDLLKILAQSRQKVDREAWRMKLQAMLKELGGA